MDGLDLFEAIRPYASGSKFDGEAVKAIDALADRFGLAVGTAAPGCSAGA